MALSSTVLAGRAAAERRMASRATVHRKSGRTTQNETTGAAGPTWDVVASDLPCRVGGVYRGDSPSRTTTSGGVQREEAVRTLHLPADTAGLRDGDLIEITDGEAVGLVLHLVEATWQDQATARRVPVVQVDRPTEWG